MPLAKALQAYPNVSVGEVFAEHLPADPEDRAIDNPDDIEPEMRGRPVRERAYYVSCAPAETIQFKHPLLAPDLLAKTSDILITRPTSLIVSAFLTDGKIQFIYGTLFNRRGFTNGVRYYLPAFDWDCGLYKNWDDGLTE